jgi:hypothetical protein
VTELEQIMRDGIEDMVAGAGSATCTIGSTAVTGIYSPGEKTAELGMGGLVNPAPAEFVYIAAAASAPSLLGVVTVSGTRKRVLGVTEDAGMISLTLGDPEDVR